MRRLRLILAGGLVAAVAALVGAQTLVNGARTFKGPQDASAAAGTLPIRAGTAAPSTGALGSFYLRRGQTSPTTQLFVFDPANTPVAIGGIAGDGNALHFYNGVGAFTVPVGLVASVNGSTGVVTVAQRVYVLAGNMLDTTQGGSTTRFLVPDSATLLTTEPNGQIAAPFAGTVRNLYFVTHGTQTAQPMTVTIATCTPTLGACTGTNSAVTLTVAGGATQNTFTDLTHSVAVASGDLISIKSVTGSTASTFIGFWSLTLRAT